MRKPSYIAAARGRATVRSQYECMCCGTTEPGTAFEISFDTVDLTWLEQRLRSYPAEARNMPHHWSSHTEGFKCPRCNGNQARGT